MVQKSSKFSITNTTKSNPPIGGLLFKQMKEAVLGKDYELSLAFISRKRSRELNHAYRSKNSSTDILSFPLGQKTGEICLSLSDSKKMASKFDRPYKNFVAFLFIHGLVHLKGYRHSSRMESIEKKYRKVFGI